MDIIHHLLLLSTVLYTLVALCFFFGLFRLNNQPCADETPFISIVIAARNEADYIGLCLDSLKQQTYPSDRFEILVVDDDSTDNTSQIVASTRLDNLHLLSVDNSFPEMVAKKRPMSVGIHRARGEWILTTDADCTVPPTWIASMASYMAADIGVVIGFSQLTSRSFFYRLQAYDFLTLMAATAGAAGTGIPWLLRDKISPIAKVFLKKSAVSATSHTAHLATMYYCSNCCAEHGMDASHLPLIPVLMQPPIALKRHHRSGSNASGGHLTPRINCVSIPFFFLILQ